MGLQDCPAGPILDRAVAEALGTAEVKPWSTDLVTAWELVELDHIAVVPLSDGCWWADVMDAEVEEYYETYVNRNFTADTAPLAVVRVFLLLRFHEARRARTAYPFFLENARAYLLGEGVDPDADP